MNLRKFWTRLRRRVSPPCPERFSPESEQPPAMSGRVRGDVRAAGLRRPILGLDFDGVLHLYTTPWRAADIIPDPPVPGMAAFLNRAVDVFEVYIFSSRAATAAGQRAMCAWLLKHLKDELGFGRAADIVEELKFPASKPPAFVTLDDRALTFTGVFPDISTLLQFKLWNRD